MTLWIMFAYQQEYWMQTYQVQIMFLCLGKSKFWMSIEIQLKKNPSNLKIG